VPENYTSLITMEIRTDVETHRVSGTVFTDRLPRIVNVDGFSVEVIPRGHMIYFSNNDKPGVIGNIGTVLGQSNVNIAGMQLGRDQEGGRALALLLVDNAVSSDVVQRLLKIDNILTAKAIKV
jgi:D-3-phosphoglycerate dehydrogenase